MSTTPTSSKPTSHRNSPALDPSPDGWRDLRGELPEYPTGHYASRTIGEITHLVIHHSGVDVDSTAQQIATYHRKLGWPGIGYHFLVHPNGRIDYVGDVTTVRYNVHTYNRQVIGICLPGLFNRWYPLPAALRATQRLITELRKLTPNAELVGHRDLAGNATACPGWTWPDWRKEIE